MACFVNFYLWEYSAEPEHPVQFLKYKLLCPRGTQTCALAVANIKVNGNGKVILDTHPESDQHQNWTVSRGSPPAPTHQIWWWSMNPFLRYLADKNSAHRHTTDTRRWPQDLAAYGAQVRKLSGDLAKGGGMGPTWVFSVQHRFFLYPFSVFPSLSVLSCPFECNKAIIIYQTV